MANRVCSKCGSKKNLETDFRKRKRDGKAYYMCRSCESSICKEWQKTDAGKRSRKKSYERRKKLFPGSDLKEMRKYRKENPEKFRGYELKKHYGISIYDWENLFNSQGRVCAICKTPTPNVKGFWSTDHDHITNEIRGILCGKCNTGIGYLQDSTEILKSAIEYLNKFKRRVHEAVLSNEGLSVNARN